MNPNGYTEGDNYMASIANARGYDSGYDKVMTPLDVYQNPVFRAVWGRLIESSRAIRSAEGALTHCISKKQGNCAEHEAARARAIAENTRYLAIYAEVRHSLEGQLVANNPGMSGSTWVDHGVAVPGNGTKPA